MSSQIPGYQVIRKVGEGGMSSVYLAIQLSTGKEVALKVLSPELRNDPSFAKQFYREGNILNSLDHYNIISIYDIGQHGEHYYMAMDYLPSTSCKELVAKKKLDPIQALRILHDVNAALGHAHDNGVIHCDIKPDNILFRSDGSAVLTDFGISQKKSTAKRSKTIAGTPNYMSPEQAQGQKLDARSDIYSLGVLLYELLTYDVPFKGKDAVSIAIKHVSAPIPKLSDELEDFVVIINKLMAKRPSARFQTTTEVAHAIDFVESRFLQHDSVNVPLKVKAEMRFQGFIHSLEWLQDIRQRASLSWKHGLVMRIVESDYDLPDVEAIAKNFDDANTLPSSTTQTTQGLSSDSIALAIEAQQAKQVLSMPAIVALSLLCISLIATPIVYTMVTDLQEHLAKPAIIYVD